MIKNKKTNNIFKNIFYYLILPFFIAWICINFIMFKIQVNMISMYPNLKDGDLAYVNILSYKLFGLDRFDTVVFHSNEDDLDIIKRVIGLPGETVKYEDDKLYINGKYIEEPFLDEEYKKEQKELLNIDLFTNDFEFILGEDEYFVLGDNRPWSKDSREIGGINSNQILGKNGFIIYPFDNFLRGVKDY